MKLIPTDANSIEQKYTIADYPLVFEYIGPLRTHGDCYYDQKRFLWIEIVREVHDDIAMAKIGGTPMGIICLTENWFVNPSLHLSCIETIRRGEGDGTAIMGELIAFAKKMEYKYFTLQPHDKEVKEFYKKFGFKDITLRKTPIMMLIL